MIVSVEIVNPQNLHIIKMISRKSCNIRLDLIETTGTEIETNVFF